MRPLLQELVHQQQARRAATPGAAELDEGSRRARCEAEGHQPFAMRMREMKYAERVKKAKENPRARTVPTKFADVLWLPADNPGEKGRLFMQMETP